MLVSQETVVLRRYGVESNVWFCQQGCNKLIWPVLGYLFDDPNYLIN